MKRILWNCWSGNGRREMPPPITKLTSQARVNKILNNIINNTKTIHQVKLHYSCKNGTDVSELLKYKLINAESVVARETDFRCFTQWLAMWGLHSTIILISFLQQREYEFKTNKQRGEVQRFSSLKNVFLKNVLSFLFLGSICFLQRFPAGDLRTGFFFQLSFQTVVSYLT